ncbi:MAG: hypothetical protein LBM73_03395 [Candidatus Nomurabacteria bacterium]|jgi:hypothetical protein|nr:hypothetical protein [Candidatus Nomurabacteria bacterium]
MSKKVSKIIAGVSAIGVMGLVGMAAVPSASYAADNQSATSAVTVTISGECQIAAATDTSTATVGDLNETTTSDSSAASAPITISCNNPTGWTLSHSMSGTASNNHLTTSGAAATGGFAPGGATGTDASALSANTWGVYYSTTAAGTGASVTYTSGYDSNFQAMGTSATDIASTSGPDSGAEITPTFGAKTDGSLPTGDYTGTVLYTLTPKATS